ncbi:MAG: 3D domain-containing protein [candidate division WOR-3 bacterium]
MRRGLVFWVVLAGLSSLNPRLGDYWSEERCVSWCLPVALLNTAEAAKRPILGKKPKDRPQPSPQLTGPAQLAPGRKGMRKGRHVGKFKVTFYWMVEEHQYDGPRTCPLYTEEGKLLGRYPKQFVDDFHTESCALLRDGRKISYLKLTNRCAVVDAPLGINGFRLQDLKSVAVDPDIIPIGSNIYIPEAEGTVLADGRVHNGVFRAHDIGSAIKGNRIDVYVGLKDNLSYFASTPLCRPGYVDVYVLN